jgi:3'-5' exoribonuclease
MVAERIGRIGGIPEPKALALSHCIVTHHGAESVPGRRFASVEAVALCRINALDAGVKGALEHGLGQAATGFPAT